MHFITSRNLFIILWSWRKKQPTKPYEAHKIQKCFHVHPFIFCSETVDKCTTKNNEQEENEKKSSDDTYEWDMMNQFHTWKRKIPNISTHVITSNNDRKIWIRLILTLATRIYFISKLLPIKKISNDNVCGNILIWFYWILCCNLKGDSMTLSHCMHNIKRNLS